MVSGSMDNDNKNADSLVLGRKCGLEEKRNVYWVCWEGSLEMEVQSQ